MSLFGSGSLLLVIACLRIAFSSDRKAALANDDGITLRTLWGTKRFSWDEITEICVKTTAVQSAYGRHSNQLLKIESRSRWAGVLSTNTIAGGELAVQEFVTAVNAHIAELRTAESSPPRSAA
jgi:hypothetical protein